MSEATAARDYRFLSRPYRLALRWVAGRDIARHYVSNAALAFLVQEGLIRAATWREGDCWLLTAEGDTALRQIEGGGA